MGAMGEDSRKVQIESTYQDLKRCRREVHDTAHTQTNKNRGKVQGNGGKIYEGSGRWGDGGKLREGSHIASTHISFRNIEALE